MRFFLLSRRLRFDIREHIKRYRLFYFLLLVLFFGGIVWGIVSGGETQFLFIQSSVDYFFRLFDGGFNFFSHFFSRLLSNLQFVLIVSIFSLHVFCFPLQMLYILYRGFIFGVAAKNIIVLFSLTGIINIIVIIIPMQIVIMFMLFYCCIVGDRRSWACFSRREYYYFWRSMPEFLWVLFRVMMVSILICVLECLLIVLVALPLNRVFL